MIELNYQEIALRSASIFQKALEDKDQKPTSNIKEVSIQVHQIGSERVKDILKPLSQGNVALPLRDYLQGREVKNLHKFLEGWSLLTAGALSQHLIETFSSGWNFADFLSLINHSITGTPIPSLNAADILRTIPPNDQHLASNRIQTQLIIRTLIEQQKLIAEGRSKTKTSVGFFYESPDNFARLIPVRRIFGTVIGNVFLDEILSAGMTIDHITGIADEKTKLIQQENARSLSLNRERRIFLDRP